MPAVMVHSMTDVSHVLLAGASPCRQETSCTALSTLMRYATRALNVRLCID